MALSSSVRVRANVGIHTYFKTAEVAWVVINKRLIERLGLTRSGQE